MMKSFFVDTVPRKQSRGPLIAAPVIICVECLVQTALHARLGAIAATHNRLRRAFRLSPTATALCALISLAMNVELLMSDLEARNAILDTVIQGRGTAKSSDIATIRSQLIDDAESVGAIVASAAHMKTMADGLLSLSRGKVPALQPIPHPPLNALRITPSPSAIPNSSPSTVKHVLLVDNDLISSRVHVRLLEAASILVTTASNGYEAIGKFINLSRSEEPVDVVLMELHIPFMDGVSTTRAIRELDESGSPPAPLFTLSNVPIIGMTTHIRSEKYVDAGLAGIDDYVKKPISREELFHLINAVHDLKLRSQWMR